MNLKWEKWREAGYECYREGGPWQVYAQNGWKIGVGCEQMSFLCVRELGVWK
jgi:hypothetical protein